MTIADAPVVLTAADLTAAVPVVGHLVNGQVLRSASDFAVIAPWSGEEIGRCPEADADLVEMAVRAAGRAQPAWAADEAARRDVLRRIVEVLEENADALGLILAAETGKPLHIARGEVAGAAHHVRWYVDRPIPVDTLVDDENETVQVVRDPIGVIAAITPWNAPLLMAVNKIAGAFLTGNTVVVKPTPFTPLTTLRLGELLADVVPPGVLNVLGGRDETGRLLTLHESVGMVSVTGSVRAGQAIMAQTAPNLTRLQLELGGNDAAIVLPDVDVAEIAPLVYRGAFALSGQICAAIKRLYVHESIFEEFVGALVAIAESARPGAPFEEGVTMGPSTTEPQFERVRWLIRDAREHGAVVRTGGDPLDRPGYFHPPTILTGVAEGVAVVDEEQFGPVLPVMSYRTVDEAVERANGTPFGLGSSVWTSDLAEGRRIAGRLRAGGAWVNRHPHVGPDVPFGGVKNSGLGREGGDAGIDAFSELKTISVPKRRD